MTGYESKRAAAQDKITDEQGRPMTYWGGKAQPAQRPWVGLTDEERKPLIQQAMMYYGYNKEYWLQTSGAGFCLFVQAIEAKLKEKNNG